MVFKFSLGLGLFRVCFMLNLRFSLYVLAQKLPASVSKLKFLPFSPLCVFPSQTEVRFLLFHWWNHEQRPDWKIINETRARWAAHLAINKTLCRPSSSITVLFRSTWHLACLIVCKNPFIASCSPCKWNGSLFGCFCLFLDNNKYPIPCGSGRGWQARRKSFSFHHRLNHNSQAKNIPCTPTSTTHQPWLQAL